MNKLHKTLIWIAAIIGIFTLAMFGSYIVLFILCPELKQKIFEQLSSNIGDFMGGDSRCLFDNDIDVVPICHFRLATKTICNLSRRHIPYPFRRYLF